MLNEGEHGSFYLLLQDDGQAIGGHQEQHREEGENGVSLRYSDCLIDDYNQFKKLAEWDAVSHR